jgi:hypothetical protein
MEIIELPKSFMMGHRRYFKRSEIEFLKKKISAEALGGDEPKYTPPEIEQFVNASAVARELGISRRTISRKIRQDVNDTAIAS